MLLIRNVHHAHSLNALVEADGLVGPLALSSQPLDRLAVPFDVPKTLYPLFSVRDSSRSLQQIVAANELEVRGRGIGWQRLVDARWSPYADTQSQS